MRRPWMLIAAVALMFTGLAGMALMLVLSSLSPQAGGDGMDAMFIEQMIPHHDDAIAMADMALERAERPEIRQLAENVKRTQTAENEQMRTWYRQRYGADVPDSSGGMGMMGSMTDLDALERADDFDREFLEQMIPHHQMAIMMTQMMVSGSGSEEMRGLARAIIDGQSREIEDMERWYREWYQR